MITITLYARQKKRHRCTEQTFGLYGRRREWDDLREQHRNMYIIKCETDCQSRLDAWDRCSGLVHWDDPEGWDGEGGGRGGFRMGTHVNPCLIHVNIWQKPLQYCKVISLQLIKIIRKKNNFLNVSDYESQLFMILFLSVKNTVIKIQSALIFLVVSATEQSDGPFVTMRHS